MKHSCPAVSCPDPLMPSTAERVSASQVVVMSVGEAVPVWKKTENP